MVARRSRLLMRWLSVANSNRIRHGKKNIRGDILYPQQYQTEEYLCRLQSSSSLRFSSYVQCPRYSHCLRHREQVF